MQFALNTLYLLVEMFSMLDLVPGKRYYNSDPDADRIQELNAEIKPLRKEIRLCADTERHTASKSGSVCGRYEAERGAGVCHSPDGTALQGNDLKA